MKQLPIFLLFSLFATTLCYSQHNISSEDEISWYSKKLKKHNITKVKEYSYKLRRNGKVKDSTLISKQEYDTLNKRIFGMKYLYMIQSHGPSYLKFYNYEEIYNQTGKLIKRKERPINPENKKTSRHFIESNYYSQEDLYEYDKNGNCIKETANNIYNSHEINKKTKDTLSSYITTTPTIIELAYENNKLITQYITKDCATIIFTNNYFEKKEVDKNKSCHDYDPKYLNIEYIYNEKDLIEKSISYTKNGTVDTKKYFYYDNKLRIVKEIDSTGSYTIKPYIKSITTYEYNKHDSTMTKINVANKFSSESSIIEIRDIRNRITKYCNTSEGHKYCISHIYENNRLKTDIFEDGDSKSFTHYSYNKQGLLYEKKTIYNKKTTQLTRYYYE
ncbi:MAG: hypothetical protein BM557_10830 [Flavobacterium sp. MedPE-SWcel]|uniref:hypothetical protein n=1 Tax=uncultured Flavobacterium sp. TaxID=165435 RepID=UPI00091861D9|nr:hypothetical protein [uncultured Flavobacterium sp.]OIQ15790.1 MAG: hypothetical protein BM557_10830 [Flavobacterium sp. MedPE-SWcel]